MFRAFWHREDGVSALTFAISAAVMVGLAFGAISFASATSEKSRIQDSLDAAALAGAQLFVGNTPTVTAIEDRVKGYLKAANPTRPELLDTNITVDSTEKSVLLRYTGGSKGAIATPVWDGVVNLSVTSKARLGAPTPYPVCILITEPFDNHTLRSGKNGFMDLNHCLVQVNTAHWDAVEAEKDGSYIHINDGQNCYVGDIHFGDVQPAKMPTCQLFPDPFKNLTIPAHSCNHTNKVVTSSATLSPGGYCGGLTINADTTFQPGVYYIKDGPLQISGGSTDVTANGVTFVLEGHNAGLKINSAGSVVVTPAAGAGDLDGFAFYQDPGPTTSPIATSYVKSANLTVKGALYFSPSLFVMSSGANITVNEGSMVTGYLLAQGGKLVFNGKGDAVTAAQIALQKDIENMAPVIVR
ncbi:MAG: hypothetical protein CFE28_11485 [Alphaproteobacteria bacterium PA2]|nr:MAG: hypothetical protein CFE28_11485 [Alphaproteobacteria bacterium PA2]